MAVVVAAACESSQVVDGFPDSYVGVGMELTIDGSHPVVVRTIDGGSAAEAGILAGDRVVTIDGRETVGCALGEVVMRIRGQPGTQVTLGLERGEHRLIVVVKRRALAKQDHDYRATKQ